MFSTARSTANVAGRSGGSSNRRVAKVRYFGLSAAWNLSCESEKRGIVTRTSPSATATSAFGSSGTCSAPVGSGRRAGLQRAASRSGPMSSSYGTKVSTSVAAFIAGSFPPLSVVEDRQVELAEARRVGEPVHLDDSPVSYREP